ncbi:hypothetical protein MHLP_04225 [Candidatus Mycoplasma haematolamae str. Purdue]|uniref:Uncharacterized protein n=1 Tax=Mycoplasma haematolamae (strain Purdue) TaxID=1212765 RepID=I7BAS5_MYCHA|nr:hypothetical protein [Candidatus Mycoplasma haematolamae]AFO52425.1 hypothetical protein MHLP_04225 [Candidatus Mycoplasma haematolamae str. Purdue]
MGFFLKAIGWVVGLCAVGCGGTALSVKYPQIRKYLGVGDDKKNQEDQGDQKNQQRHPSGASVDTTSQTSSQEGKVTS